MLNDIKDFIVSFWKKLHAKKLFKRYAWLIIACLLTLLIPLTIAFGYIYFIKEPPKVDAVNISVELYDPDGMIIANEKTQEDILEASQLAKLFYDLSSSKIRADKPEEFSKKQTMSFSITYGNEKSSFKCYFEEDVSQSYIEDKNGNFFSPDVIAYDNLLNSNFGEIIYKESVPPTLCTADNTSILPYEVDWSYLRANGKATTSKNFDTTPDLRKYHTAGAIDLSFSREPTKCEITVQQTNGKLHTFTSLKELSSLNASEGDELLIKIDAEWSEANSSISSFGKQAYEFAILCSKPSLFTLSSNEAFGGEFIIISISNVDNADSIKYLPDIPESHKTADLWERSTKTYKALDALYNYKPIFAKEGSHAYALLPIPSGIPDMNFDFSLSCGISRASFSLELKAPTLSDISFSESSPNKNITLTSGQKAEFSRIVFSLTHITNDLKLFDGEFLSPEDHGFAKNIGYNTVINGSFDMLANNYSAKEIGGTPILSLAAGRVMQVGHSELLGNYVIVDHGLGLSTWYCGLSDTNVSLGDFIKKGDILGKAGSSSALCNNGVNIICSVGEVLIDPNNIIGKSIIEEQK